MLKRLPPGHPLWALVLLCSLPPAPIPSVSPLTTWKIIWISRRNRVHNAKSADAKAKVRESIRALNPDVLALEEMGDQRALGIARVAQSRRTGFSVLGIGERRGHEHPRRRVEQISHRRAPSAHERRLSAGWPPLSRQPRFCRSGHSGRDQFHLHAHRRAFEIAPCRARRRRSRRASRRGKNSARHCGRTFRPPTRTPG